MNRVSPDIVKKIQSYVGSGMSMFGQSVDLRKFISASAGNPDFGIADKLYYQSRPTLMELRVLSIEEVQMIGGQDIRGTLEFVSKDPVDMRDEVLYNGVTYRCLSQPERETIGATLFWRGIVQRASITANFN